jgi:thiol-disulfide isomerase/thioredoxin
VYAPSALTPRESIVSKFSRILIFLFFFALTATLSASAYSQEAAPTTPDSGPVIRFVRNPDQAPDFKMNDLDGKPLSLSASRGKVILLNFWATWCGPCRAEIPDLIELQKKYGDRLQIIGLDVDDDDVAEVRKFVETNGINYPVGMATNEIRIQYGGVAALPTSFVLDDQGRVVQKHEGLRNPLLYEYEIRALIGLPIPARVETFEDTGEIFLKHADRASVLPGVDMSKLTPEQKLVALHRFNAEGCTCGCQFTLAQCRIYDRNCPISKARTTKIMAEVTGHAGASPEHKAESPKAAPGSPVVDTPNPNPSQHDIP